jgi:hypothetical protein
MLYSRTMAAENRAMQLRLAMVSLFFSAVSLAADCDVGTIDFANTLELNSSYHALKFQDGVAHLYLVDEQRERNEPEFRFKLEHAITLQPESGTTVRMLNISGEHLRGTGFTGQLVAYTCRDGKVEQIFELHRAGVRFEELSATSFRVTSPHWLRHDAHASPSRSTIEVYEWSSRAKTWQRVSSTISREPFRR